jgi:hypothetical protein
MPGNSWETTGMARKPTSKNYTIQPFRMGPDQREIDLLTINFLAEDLASARTQTMIYASNAAFVEDIHGLKLMRNSAEVWRWVKGEEPGLNAKQK